MSSDPLNIAVTGAAGFIGANLLLRLRELGHVARPIVRDTPEEQVRSALAEADVVFHLAGANRPIDGEDYLRTNRDYTQRVANSVAQGGRKPLIVHSGSGKAIEDTPYGRSKRAGEEVLLNLAAAGRATVSIWRLPNIFGKWARPNYNSAVATFCHNAARGLPLRIDDPAAPLSLLHIDDLLDQWLEVIERRSPSGIVEPRRVHRSTVGEVAGMISSFAARRSRGETEGLGTGLIGALYSTFVSAMPVEQASVSLEPKIDGRGIFVELWKTAASGQISVFSAHPGVTRGGHYHHSKVEKFVVAAGTARFRFRHVITGEEFALTGSAGEPKVIETIPGWTHDVTNMGDDELVVVAWANEVFDPARPDTVWMPL
jgi:UDP-2-acetamido-2,6-beta-L-arabino-hexul-4-ose reductase